MLYSSRTGDEVYAARYRREALSMTAISLLLRVLGGVALAVFVWEIDAGLAGGLAINWWNLAIAVASGFLLGLLVTPDVTLKPLVRLRERLTGSPDDVLVGGICGLLVGLVVAALVAVPLSLLPRPAGRLLPLAAALVLAYFGVSVGLSRGAALAHRLGFGDVTAAARGVVTVVDSSVIIDGRLAAIHAAGFLPGRLVVPAFVVAELQGLADSANATVRARGRRGLDLLLELQQAVGDGLEITPWAGSPTAPVDARLVAMAQAEGMLLLTNDANLARVAELQHIRVLSIHTLALALRQQLTPGERTRVRVVQEGTEARQGRAYLNDGTLVVVEGGRPFLGKEVDVVIQRSVQTPQGKLFFALPVALEAESVR